MTMRDQEALRLRQVAIDAMWQGRFDEAIEQYDAALAVAESEETSELITIGKAEALIAAEREGAEVTALPAIVMRRRSPRHVYLAAYALMRKISETTDRRRALFYGEIARQATVELGDAFSRAKVLNGLAIILTVESRFSDAIGAYDEALAALMQVRDRESEVAMFRAHVIGGLGGAKVLAGEVEEGIRLLGNALPQLDGEYSRAEALLDMCFGYLELERYMEAEYLGREALALASIRRQVRNANHLLGEVMLRTKRYEEADEFFTVVAGFYPEYPNVKDLLVTVDLCGVVNWKG